MAAKRFGRRSSAGLMTAGGHRVWLDDTTLEVVVSHSGGSVIRIDAAGRVEITAAAGVHVTAPTVTIDSSMTRVNGLLTCDTLVASTGVVSPWYSPGVGNLE